MAIIKAGYIWSEKQKLWRKLPRRVWLRMQRQRLLKIARDKKSEGNS